MAVFRKRPSPPKGTQFDRFAERSTGSIETKRWGWIANKISSDEARLITTPVWLMMEPYPRRGHVFLTSHQVLIAVTEPPLGTEDSPGVMRFAISDITRLVTDTHGYVYTFNPNKQGEPAYNILNLYPSPLSQEFVWKLVDLWKESTGRETEGDWTPWIGVDASAIHVSQKSWASGKSW